MKGHAGSRPFFFSAIPALTRRWRLHCVARPKLSRCSRLASPSGSRALGLERQRIARRELRLLRRNQTLRKRARARPRNSRREVKNWRSRELPVGTELEFAPRTSQKIDLAVESDLVVVKESTPVINLKRHAGARIQSGTIASRQSRYSTEPQGELILAPSSSWAKQTAANANRSSVS